MDSYVSAAAKLKHDLGFITVNVRQSQEFYRRVDDLLPVLTTKTALIWGRDMKGKGKANYVDRPLISYELYGAHGYPVLLPAKHPLAELLPLQLRPRAIAENKAPDDKTSQRFVGNGMHLSQVGLAIACALFGVAPHPGQEHGRCTKRMRIALSFPTLSHA